MKRMAAVIVVAALMACGAANGTSVRKDQPVPAANQPQGCSRDFDCDNGGYCLEGACRR